MYRKWMLSSRGLDIAVILGYNPKNSLASPRSRNAVAWESFLVCFLRFLVVVKATTFRPQKVHNNVSVIK